MSPDFKAWREGLKDYYVKNNIYNPIIFFKWNFPIVGYLENKCFEEFVDNNFNQTGGFLYNYVDWSCPMLTKDIVNILEKVEFAHIPKNNIIKRLFLKALYNKKARLIPSRAVI